MLNDSLAASNPKDCDFNNSLAASNHTCPAISDNSKSENLCCLWTEITGVTMGQSLIIRHIYNPWSKWSRKL